MGQDSHSKFGMSNWRGKGFSSVMFGAGAPPFDELVIERTLNIEF